AGSLESKLSKVPPLIVIPCFVRTKNPCAPAVEHKPTKPAANPKNAADLWPIRDKTPPIYAIQEQDEGHREEEQKPVNDRKRPAIIISLRKVPLCFFEKVCCRPDRSR